MITVYLVGPLFTEADQRQRRLEGNGCAVNSQPANLSIS